MEQLYAFVVEYLTPLPETFGLFVEYVLQSPARKTFHETRVVYDEDKLKRRLEEFFIGYAWEKGRFGSYGFDERLRKWHGIFSG
ncbi:hypothetical protein RvY_14458 [Ramazzottius varieornatus]|uniref:Uncharacterized protein n=1 Tax=Ramazzottius varieornatus TaxID=947166 RepID=A0A1D1VT37_RAMVA|nr:hypothetical protein RvY_14458 [Ramazzottius varieornatus]